MDKFDELAEQLLNRSAPVMEANFSEVDSPSEDVNFGKVGNFFDDIRRRVMYGEDMLSKSERAQLNKANNLQHRNLTNKDIIEMTRYNQAGRPLSRTAEDIASNKRVEEATRAARKAAEAEAAAEAAQAKANAAMEKDRIKQMKSAERHAKMQMFKEDVGIKLDRADKAVKGWGNKLKASGVADKLAAEDAAMLGHKTGLKNAIATAKVGLGNTIANNSLGANAALGGAAAAGLTLGGMAIAGLTGRGAFKGLAAGEMAKRRAAASYKNLARNAKSKEKAEMYAAKYKTALAAADYLAKNKIAKSNNPDKIAILKARMGKTSEEI